MRKQLAWMLTAMLMAMPCASVAETADATDDRAIVYFHDGSRALISAEIANDPAALNEYCATYFPGRTYTIDASADLTYDAVLSAEQAAAWFGAGSSAVGVSLVTLGVSSSLVAVNGEERTVPTSALTFDASVAAKQRIAVVHAPRTGEATLRETASGSGKKVLTCKAGKVVAVLEYNGGTFTRIRYEEEEGYIRTDCLIFHDGTEIPMGSGILHADGATDGKKKVTVWSTASTANAKTTAWASGTEVTVLSQEDGWYAVEKDGWYGFVQESALAMAQ